MVLGIPRRVNIVELWERQCSGVRCLTTLTTVFAWLGELWLAANLIEYAVDEMEDPVCKTSLSLVVTALALASQAAPVLAWRYSMDAPGYEEGLCLKLAIAALVIFACAWVFRVGLVVVYAWRCRGQNQRESNTTTQPCIEDDRMQEV
ncbi:hypothetical protein PINS_up019198 [Pythium insidiosum]|nr:hypothetical protein PINS_up019198 [Pythium insidiosum]